MKRKRGRPITSAQLAARQRNFLIFRLRAVANLFRQLGNGFGIEIVNDELRLLGVPTDKLEK